MHDIQVQRQNKRDEVGLADAPELIFKNEKKQQEREKRKVADKQSKAKQSPLAPVM